MRVRALTDCFYDNVYRTQGTIFDAVEDAPGVFESIEDDVGSPEPRRLVKRVPPGLKTQGTPRPKSPLEE